MKNAKCDAYAFFCGTNSHNREAEDQPEVRFFKILFTHSDYSRSTPSAYAGLVVAEVFKISSKYVGIIRSLSQEGH